MHVQAIGKQCSLSFLCLFLIIHNFPSPNILKYVYHIQND